MSDWLDIESVETDSAVPGLAPGSLVLATEEAEKRAQFLTCWNALTETQRVFLNAWRECRFNANRTFRMLRGTAQHCSKSTVTRWGEDPNFAAVREILRGASMQEILSKDYLVARQEDIVEQLLEPKPILYQGFPTGYEENQAAGAAKANEVLLRIGGHLKEKEIDVNVGLVGPSLNIQVVQQDGTVRSLTHEGVAVELPEPEAVDVEWVDAT